MNDKQEPQKTPEQTPSKIREIIKEGSGLGLLKVVGTSLTAVSMAIISAKIAGFVNSLMLVAVLSIGTALVSEFYRILLSFTSLGAKKIVAPVLKTVENKQTGEIIVISEQSPIVAVDVSEIEKQEEILKLNFFGKLKKKTVRYFANNALMRFMAIFAAVALITIGVNYLIAPNNEPAVYNYTTHRTTEQIIEDNTPDEPIIEEKTVVVKEVETDTPDEKAAPITETESPIQQPITRPEPTTVIDDNDAQNIDELRERIEALEEENTTLKTEVDTLKGIDTPAQPETPEDTVSTDEMNEQIKELQRQIDELKTSTPSSQVNSQGDSSANTNISSGR